jgi:hypothetical protein
MDSRAPELMKDSSLSFFDSLASILTNPYFVCPQVVANDDEFGFDPLPSMESHPEYVSLSKIYDGGHKRSQLEWKDKDLDRGCVKLTETNELSSYKHGKESLSLKSSEESRAYTDPSSHVVRHGQITPPITSPSMNKTTKVVKRSAHTSPGLRKSHQFHTATKATRLATSFKSNAEPFAMASDRTGRKPPRLRTPVRLLNDRERKLSLEKNKIAAANCRIKKQKKENGLQAQSRELVSKNTILKQSVSDMTQHLQELRCMLQFHVLSEGCYAPTHIHKALGESGHDSFSPMSLCDNDGLDSTGELCQKSLTSDTYTLPDMVGDDWCFPDTPSLEGPAPHVESLLPILGLTPALEADPTLGLEMTMLDSIPSALCDLVAS